MGYLANARPEKGDPAHLSAHLSFEWAKHSAGIEEGESVEFRNRGSALLTLGTYSGWYARLHTLRREFESDPYAAGDFNRVEVEVAGLGPIGSFVFDITRQCFVLAREEANQAAPTTSPRYNFQLTGEIIAKLSTHGVI